MIKKTITTNRNTGEFREKVGYVDNLFSKKGYIMKYNQSYVKLFFDKGLPNECTLTDCGKFYKITRYIVGENQLLGYRSDKIRPLTTKKMADMFNCSERQTRRFVKSMKDIGVIKEVNINGVNWYAINPLYALKSKYLSLTTFIIFQEELIPVLPAWVVYKFMSEAKELLDNVKVKE